MAKKQMFCIPHLFCVDYKFIVVMGIVGLFVVFFGQYFMKPQLKIVKETSQPIIIQDRRQDIYERKVDDKLIEPSQEYRPERSRDPQYQMMGFLYREESDPDFNVDSENRLKLFGRRSLRNRNQFNYYVTLEKSDLKIPLSDINSPINELNDGDKISVKGFSGQFNVEIYEYSNTWYNPFF